MLSAFLIMLLPLTMLVSTNKNAPSNLRKRTYRKKSMACFPTLVLTNRFKGLGFRPLNVWFKANSLGTVTYSRKHQYYNAAVAFRASERLKLSAAVEIDRNSLREQEKAQ
jgi:hypothetical protein